jgi:hemerythrin-like domain-containing protein
MSGNGNPYADTRDMYTVHTMFRREYALLPGLVRAVAAKDEERAHVVADHVRLMNLILHHHHTAEDEGLWPRLLQRAPREVDPVVQLLAGQHDNLDVLLDDVDARLDSWPDGADSADGEALATVLRQVAVALYEHMGLEEQLALPLVERHVFATEWEAMIAAGAAEIPPEIGPVLVGMLMYEGGLDAAPPQMRDVLAEAAPKAYAGYSERLHGTPTPPLSTQVGLGTPYVGVTAGVGRD